MSSLSAGFGLIEITPLVGTPLIGQLYPRYSTGVHDPLFARVLALRDGEDDALRDGEDDALRDGEDDAPREDDANAVMIIVLDVCKVPEYDADRIRDAITAKLPIPRDHIWVFATHTHTGPALHTSVETPRADKYATWLHGEVARAAATAWEDLAPATVKFVQTDVDGIGFVRRYRMKDGSVRTNPGVGNPDIVEPTRRPRTRFSLVEFERDPTRLPIVFGAYPCHADVVGGLDASADYPGRVCSELTHRIDTHPESIFALGPCGDINHIDVNANERLGGHEHAQKMARTLVDAALGVWDKREKIDGALDIRRTKLTVSRRDVTDEQIAEAKALIAREMKPGGESSTEVVFARGMLLVTELPREIEIEICAVVIGEVAFVCLPGELFSELAEKIEDASPFAHTFCVELLASAEAGYIGTREAYAEGGYETRPMPSSQFAPGTGERVVEEAVRLLTEKR